MGRYDTERSRLIVGKYGAEMSTEGHFAALAHRNETAVGLGGGPRPKNSAAVRPSESAGRTAGRRSGRPKSAGRDRR